MSVITAPLRGVVGRSVGSAVLSAADTPFVPTLDYNYASTMALGGGETFTRASAGWYYNSSGVLTSAATNAARFDYDPTTLLPLGLLIEEARTNSLRNNSMTGAAVGTPGTLPTNWSVTVAAGMTTNVIATGTSNGLPYIDLQLTGSPSSSAYAVVFETSSAIAASSAQLWASSFFISRVGGTTTNIASINNSVEGVSGTITETAATVTTTSTRCSHIGTMTTGTTFARNRLVVRFTTTGVATDITLRVGAPVLELGAFVTSPILTTTVAVTRAADVCTIATLGSWFNAAAGTLLIDFTLLFRKTSGVQVAAFLDDNTNNNRIGAFATGGTGQTEGNINTGGSGQASISLGSPTAGTRYAVAVAYATNDVAAYRSSGQSGTDNTVTLPVVTQIRIGHRGADYLNGWVRRIAYAPARVDAANLVLAVA